MGDIEHDGHCERHGGLVDELARMMGTGESTAIDFNHRGAVGKRRREGY